MSSNLSKSIFGLAHDISFAVFRVARVVKNMRLKTALEDAAVDLVANLSETVVDKLLTLIKLTASINEIKSLNAEVLERELNILSGMLINTAISANRIGNEKEPDLAESFTRIRQACLRSQEKSNGNIALRQSAVLVFIRELPNGCRMRDLLTKFPEVSERTLRNDLQILTAEDKIERFGTVQGPFSYFRAKPKQVSSIE